MTGLFGWLTAPSEPVDPRWAILDKDAWTCRSCGELHTGLFDLACRRPEVWTDGEDYAPNSEVQTSNHMLSEDFCILDGEAFFVRATLPIPLRGSGGQFFHFGVWSTLSPANFRLYLEHFNDGEFADGTRWFGWFANRLKGYPDTLSLKCHVWPQRGRQRPLLELEQTDHPLAREQSEGMTFERLIEIYKFNGHEPPTSSLSN